jgi:hypothetical protein
MDAYSTTSYHIIISSWSIMMDYTIFEPILEKRFVRL